MLTKPLGGIGVVTVEFEMEGEDPILRRSFQGSAYGRGPLKHIFFILQTFAASERHARTLESNFRSLQVTQCCCFSL